MAEIRIIENGPECGVRVLVEELCRSTGWPIVYMHIGQGNKSTALNYAIQDLDDEFIVFFDDDIRVGEDCLISYEAAFSNSGGREFFGGPFQCDYETTPPAWLLDHLPKSAKGWDPRDGNRLYPEMPFIGFNWAARARDIKSIGGFRAEYGPGQTVAGTGQELIAQEALIAGGLQPIFVEGAMVYHYIPTERCSPAWCLDRSFRNGISAGFRMHPIEANSRAWLTLARYSLKLIKLILRMPTSAFLNPKSERYFEKTLKMYLLWGVVVGNWRRLRSSEKLAKSA